MAANRALLAASSVHNAVITPAFSFEHQTQLPYSGHNVSAGMQGTFEIGFFTQDRHSRPTAAACQALKRFSQQCLGSWLWDIDDHGRSRSTPHHTVGPWAPVPFADDDRQYDAYLSRHMQRFDLAPDSSLILGVQLDGHLIGLCFVSVNLWNFMAGLCDVWVYLVPELADARNDVFEG